MNFKTNENKVNEKNKERRNNAYYNKSHIRHQASEIVIYIIIRIILLLYNVPRTAHMILTKLYSEMNN